MGRKIWGGLELVAITSLLSLFVLPPDVSSYKEVGCLFSRDLCKLDNEICYNDLAFGRCVPRRDSLTDDDLYQYNLNSEELELLQLQLERLEYEGFKWPHFYTQCVMQALLYDLRYRLNNDVESLCEHLKVINGDRYELEDEIIDENDIDKDSLPSTKFGTKQENVNTQFGEEVFFPKNVKQNVDGVGKPSRFDDYDDTFYDKLNYLENPDEVYSRDSRSLNEKTSYPRPYQIDNYEKPRNFDIFNPPHDVDSYDRPPSDIFEYLQNYKGPSITESEDDGENERNFNEKYKPLKAMSNIEFLEQNESNPDRIRADDEDYIDDREEYANFPKSLIDSLGDNRDVYLDGQGQYEPVIDDDELMALWKEMAFKRPERLDVKKPGPLFSTNNFAFRAQPETPFMDDDDNDDDNTQENEDIKYLPQMSKKLVPKQLENVNNDYQNVDLDHVYLQFDQEIHSWHEGDLIVKTVEQLIGLKRGELNQTRVGRAEVTFRVEKNSKNLDANDIVAKIDEIRNDLYNKLHFKVIRAGIGDKAKLPAIFEEVKYTVVDSSLFYGIVSAGVAGVTVAAIILIFIVRNHAKSRAKLAGLRTPDPEASKDYQDLCRVRMQAKTPTEKALGSPKAFNFARLIESKQSESMQSRSGTPTWGEEPHVTNMDLATGKKILKYLEDHLKNQSKIDEEWKALCAYEAEPCSTAIAEAEGNSEFNRSGSALPYDHSRVVLNDLVNVKNLDYINASTITDHDPRNPAYIATQGPLPQTTSDFWQLVWEQGSVVIVMLTKLTENDKIMCHRYWPEEGSTRYDIYEVHLVSEHIWCDDYLVRSFYLKNLRTSETRTVTQFYFLTWPENGVPDSAKTLLEFRRKVNKSYRGRSCPIVVHCSDGAGRTGTYCVIDMILNRLAKGAKDVDIPSTLEHIRDQRPKMVANKKQYEFIWRAVTDEIQSILKTLSNDSKNESKKSSPVAGSSNASTSKKSDSK